MHHQVILNTKTSLPSDYFRAEQLTKSLASVGDRLGHLSSNARAAARSTVRSPATPAPSPTSVPVSHCAIGGGYRPHSTSN